MVTLPRPAFLLTLHASFLVFLPSSPILLVVCMFVTIVGNELYIVDGVQMPWLGHIARTVDLYSILHHGVLLTTPVFCVQVGSIHGKKVSFPPMLKLSRHFSNDLTGAHIVLSAVIIFFARHLILGAMPTHALSVEEGLCHAPGVQMQW